MKIIGSDRRPDTVAAPVHDVGAAPQHHVGTAAQHSVGMVAREPHSRPIPAAVGVAGREPHARRHPRKPRPSRGRFPGPTGHRELMARGARAAGRLAGPDVGVVRRAPHTAHRPCELRPSPVPRRPHRPA